MTREKSSKPKDCNECRGQKDCCEIVEIIEDNTNLAELLQRELHNHKLQ